MPFMTYGLKKINVTEEVKAAAFGLLAKRFTTPKGTLIQLLDIYRTVSKDLYGVADRYLDGGLVIILSVVHSKHHACGQAYYFNIMNTEVKAVLDLDNLDYQDDDYHARQDDKLQISNLDIDSYDCPAAAVYSRFNYQGFITAQEATNNKITDTITERIRNEK